MMEEISIGEMSSVRDSPRGEPHGGMQETVRGRGWKIEPLERERGVQGSRVCKGLSLFAASVILLACYILWDNTGGDNVRGYEVGRLIRLHPLGARAGAYPVHRYGNEHESRREMIRKASSMARLSQRNSRVKQLLKSHALQLATKAAISEVATTYSPEAWFAMHRHPEKAAMLHVAKSRHDDDTIIDQVEGELIDPHYKGKFNPLAMKIHRAATKEYIGRHKLDDMAEQWASAATSKALHKLESNAGKSWVDHGVSGDSSQGLYAKAAAQQGGWIKTQVDQDIDGDSGKQAAVHRASRQHDSDGAGARVVSH